MRRAHDWSHTVLVAPFLLAVGCEPALDGTHADKSAPAGGAASTAPAQSPGAPVEVHAPDGDCGQCSAPEETFGLPAGVFAAFGSKRTRGSNSQLPVFANRLLADINADGVADLLSYAADRFAVSSTEFGLANLFSATTSGSVRRLITGDFSGDGSDQVCAILHNNKMSCFRINAARTSLLWWFDQAPIASEDEDTIVGDFDGDRRDDVFVYHRISGAMRMYSTKGTSYLNPTPKFSAGNLSGTPGGRQIRAGDFNGDGRDDLILINAGQIFYYNAVFDGTNHTFWWNFTSWPFIGANDEIVIGRVDDDPVDDLVLRNTQTGETRFHHVDWNDGWPPRFYTVELGQMNLDGNSQVFFAPLRGVLGEPGGSTRDDALVFVRGLAGVVRSDARWDGSAHTYRWSYTWYENPLPVQLYAQEVSQWCWAASGQMVMTYLGKPVSQCEQANRRFSRKDCCNKPTPSSCNNGGWPDFNGFGFNSSTTSRGTALTFAQLNQEIWDYSRPVAFSWGWSGGGGHMMVAMGTKVVNGTQYVTMNDPWAPSYGNQSDILYTTYVSASDHSHWTDYYGITKR